MGNGSKTQIAAVGTLVVALLALVGIEVTQDEIDAAVQGAVAAVGGVAALVLFVQRTIAKLKAREDLPPPSDSQGS